MQCGSAPACSVACVTLTSGLRRSGVHDALLHLCMYAVLQMGREGHTDRQLACG